MPPEQVEEIRAWLIKAARDLEAARRLIETEEPLLARDVISLITEYLRSIQSEKSA